MSFDTEIDDDDFRPRRIPLLIRDELMVEWEETSNRQIKSNPKE